MSKLAPDAPDRSIPPGDLAGGEVDLASVPSPYEGKKLTLADQLAISAYWFATNFHWGALLFIMLPGEMRKMAPAYRVPALGLLTGIAALVALVVPLFVGALSDRCVSKLGRRRPYIAAGVAINVLGLAMMAATIALFPSIHTGSASGVGLADTISVLFTSPTFLLFLLGYMVVQLGNNIASAAYMGVIPDLVPEDQRGSASGYMALMSQLGTLLGALGSGFVLNKASELSKYAVVAGVMAIVAVITVWGIRENPMPVRPPKLQWGKYVKSLWIDPKLYPDFAWVWVTRALVMLGFYSVLPYVNYYLIDVIHIEHPEMQASLLIGVLLLAASISGIWGGYISDKIGRKKVVYFSNVVIALMALSFIFCRHLPQVLVAGLFFGFGFGAYTSVDWALGTDVLPSRSNAAKEMAVWHISMTLPQSLAAPAAGVLIAAYGKTPQVVDGELLYHYTHAGYASVFVLCAVCFALGAYLLKNVRGVN